MRLRILLLPLLALAGIGASYALANGGKPHHGRFQGTTTTAGSCQRTHVSGTSAPQTFTVTVAKSGEDSSLAPGQVVTVTVGGTGQTVRVNVEGCLSGSTLTAREAELHAFSTAPPPTTSTPTTTTGTTTGGGYGGHHGRHHGHGYGHQPGTTTTTTTTG